MLHVMSWKLPPSMAALAELLAARVGLVVAANLFNPPHILEFDLGMKMDRIGFGLLIIF